MRLKILGNFFIPNRDTLADTFRDTFRDAWSLIILKNRKLVVFELRGTLDRRAH